MSTIHYQGIDEILRSLDDVRARKWSIQLVAGLVAMLTVVVASLLIVAVCAGYWTDQPPAPLRWALLGGTCAAWAAALVWFVLRSMVWKQNPAQLARFVEQATPELHNNLINSIQLSRDDGQVSPEMVQQAIHEALRHARRVDLGKSVSLGGLKRWSLAAGGAAAAMLLFGLLQPRVLQRGLLAVIQPTSYVSTQGAVTIEKVSPGDTTIYANDTVSVAARAKNPDAVDLPAEVILEDGRTRPMVGSLAFTHFALPLGKIDQTTRYAVRIGDTRYPPDRKWYVITVLQHVQVTGIDLRYEYPAYTGWDPKTVKKADGPVTAPIGSDVTATVHVSRPVPGATMILRGPTGEPTQTVTMAPSVNRMRFTARIPVDGKGGYRIEFFNQEHKCIGRLPDLGAAPSAPADAGAEGFFPIEAQPDAPPRIEFLEPNADATVAPGGKLKLKVHVADKYGLSAAALQFGLEGKDDLQPAPGFGASAAGKTDLTFEYELDLSKFPLYSVIEYHATVADNRSVRRLSLGPQTTVSKTFRVTIQDPARAAAKKAQSFEMLRKRLMAILDLQIGQRVNARICAQSKELEDVQTVGGQLVDGQKKIHGDLDDLARNFPFEPEMETVKLAVTELTANEAALAIQQALVLSDLAAMGSRDRACELLGTTQDDIIDSLQTLLSIMPQLEKKAEEKKDKAGDDLPPDVEDKIAKLKDAMKEFQDEERKAITASKRLAKTPKDAFTADDEKVLKELAATQDKWEKFINEAITDFSKLLKQDFANPQLMKELVAVKTDVTMAKDALKKKASEIATAAEDSGVENAKSLTANLEKWLPDEPDRTKWAMEDLATSDQDNLEQAELPTELEDLVGDLLEQEEDLFDEMDDVSSKSSTSGDKGIGWDAMDGPISSMNAQGVTGNQLPNTSEIHGRSGEGRSGKCTGEFVEDKAVGKGGRRTPTRLTPEPFQKGQVNDTSTEPPGGATGGGKLSGSGEEGLEGPVPPPVAQEMKRLAGKQASLLNRAERIRTGFKISDMSHYKLSKAMKLMDRVYDDLKNFRYQNVLRGRHATIKSLQDLAGRTGEIDVTLDSSSNMPKYIRDNIADAMKGDLPEEYRAVLEKYYRRIGELGAGTTPEPKK